MNMIIDQENFHLRWLIRYFEYLEVRRLKGDRDIEVSVDSLQSLLMENIGLTQRLDRLEKMMSDGYNLYSWNQPIIVKKEPVQ